MKVKEFLQICVNHGIETVTTMEVTRALNSNRNTVFSALRKIEKDGAIWHKKKGNKSYWVMLGMSYNGPYKPNTDEKMYEDYTLPIDNEIDLGTRASMFSNYVRPTIKPTANDEFLTVIDPYEDERIHFSRDYVETISNLKEAGLTIKYTY
jgi:hypothetical protein